MIGHITLEGFTVSLTTSVLGKGYYEMTAIHDEAY